MQGAKPPRRPKNREHKVNTQPIDIIPSLQANKPTMDRIQDMFHKAWVRQNKVTP
jgi:hypothetical protein